MKILAPSSPLSLEFFKDDVVTTLVMVVTEDNLWNLAFDSDLSTFLCKKSGTWQDAFKATLNIVEDLETQGWDMDEQGYTVPLFVQEGSSDKEYHVNLTKSAEGWSTTCLYGRRGSALKPANKICNASLTEAWKQFRTVVADQIKKGYQLYIAGVSYQSNKEFKKIQDLPIALLTDTLNANSLLEDEEYFMQEKFDGERRPILSKAGTILGTNKEGTTVNLNSKFEEGLKSLNRDFQIDCEDLGDKLAVFDITSLDGVSLIGLSFDQRLDKLTNLFEGAELDFLILAKVAKSTEDKKNLFKTLIDRKAEGVVFKKKSAQYFNGKSLTDAMLKFKFYAEATVLVLGVNSKRSVQMGVFDNDRWVAIGNVTIPANANIPNVGDILEVRYLYAYKGGCLFLPTYKSLRTDQNKEACSITKLKYKAEYTYTSEILKKTA